MKRTRAWLAAVTCVTRNMVWTASLFLGASAAAAALSADWPGWRGPTGLGYTEENDLPLTWGGRNNENVLWAVRIDRLGPFQSYSSPIVCRDRVFITASTDKRGEGPPQKPPEHWVACYRASDGKQLWETVVPPGPWLDVDPHCGYAVPTPVTDGKTVYACFGSAVMVALDFDGHVVWRKERPGPYHFSGYQWFCTSPILYEDTVLQLCDQDKGASFLMALDKKTGLLRWERKRPTVGSTDSTPILIRVKGRWQLIIAATNALQGLDPKNGGAIWWCTCPRHPASPAYGSGLIVTGSGVAVDPTGEGDVTKTHLRRNTGKVPDGYSSPIIVGDHVYQMDGWRVLKCRKLATGELVYSERLPGGKINDTGSSPFATPDGRIYLISWSEMHHVIQAGPTFRILASNDPLTLQSMIGYTSPAVSGGRIFLKGGHLWCIGRGDPARDKQ